MELMYFSKNPQHKNLNLKNKRHLRLTHQPVLKHQTGLWGIKRKRINKNPRGLKDWFCNPSLVGIG